ncbi:MAG: RidA family protein [Rhodobacteraceae bacterium]|nr:RidA family protein [Paracoccaceae bacterium]
MAPAALSGDFLFCTGFTGVSPQGVLSEDPGEQAREAFRILSLTLGEADLDLSDVVEMTSYHVGLHATLPTFRQVREAVLTPPYPAWTAIGVSELATPGAVVEIRAIARRRMV